MEYMTKHKDEMLLDVFDENFLTSTKLCVHFCAFCHLKVFSNTKWSNRPRQTTLAVKLSITFHTVETIVVAYTVYVLPHYRNQSSHTVLH